MSDLLKRISGKWQWFAWMRGTCFVPVALLLWAYGWGLPALEDDRFWWIPLAQSVAEQGPSLTPGGALPSALLPPHTPPPPQWSGGLPDYAHPPLFFLYLGLWLWTFGSSMHVVHLALLPLALLAAWGTRRLALQLVPSGYADLAACLLLIQPPVVAQLARADLDLALLAVLPWCLEALLRQRPLRFAVLAGVAVWIKEPGVLLLAPALVTVLVVVPHRRLRMGLAALSPLLALGLWALVHRLQAGWALASLERLAPDTRALLHDLGQVLSFGLLEQGRWLLSLFTVVGVWSAARRAQLELRLPVLVLWTQLAAWLLFFGTINFLGGDALRPFGSHWRYLVPVFPALVVLGMWGLVQARVTLIELSATRSPSATSPPTSAPTRAPISVQSSTIPRNQNTAPQWEMRLRWWLPVIGLPLLIVQSLLGWHSAPSGGVERNLAQWDLARAHLRLRSSVKQALEAGIPVWVGSYAYLEYVSPVVGFPDYPPLVGLSCYGMDVDTGAVAVGDLVLESAFGEPLGRMSQDLELEVVERVQVYHSWARLHRVKGRRDATPPF